MNHTIIDMSSGGKGNRIVLDDRAYADLLRRHSQKRVAEIAAGAWDKPAEDQDEIDQRLLDHWRIKGGL